MGRRVRLGSIGLVWVSSVPKQSSSWQTPSFWASWTRLCLALPCPALPALLLVPSAALTVPLMDSLAHDGGIQRCKTPETTHPSPLVAMSPCRPTSHCQPTACEPASLRIKRSEYECWTGPVRRRSQRLGAARHSCLCVSVETCILDAGDPYGPHGHARLPLPPWRGLMTRRGRLVTGVPPPKLIEPVPT